MTRTIGRLELDPARVKQARTLARRVGRPVVTLAKKHTTVSVERATLRLAGLAGADPDGTPWVNRLVDAVRADVGLEHGVALPVWDALARAARPTTSPDLRSARVRGRSASGSRRVATPPAPRVPRARRSAPACGGSTPVARSASGWWPRWATPLGPRGST